MGIFLVAGYMVIGIATGITFGYFLWEHKRFDE